MHSKMVTATEAAKIADTFRKLALGPGVIWIGYEDALALYRLTSQATGKAPTMSEDEFLDAIIHGAAKSTRGETLRPTWV